MGFSRSIHIIFLLIFIPASGFSSTLEQKIESLENYIIILQEDTEDLRINYEGLVQISGYTDVEYVVEEGKDSGFRMHHLSLFFYKKLNDHWRFFSEIEYEDTPLHDFRDKEAQKAEGKIFVEAVNLDFQWKPEAIFRFGRFFTPAGIWSIDHYPPFVPTQERPQHIRKIFPQLVDGLMSYGTLQMGKHFFKYDAYLANGEESNGRRDNDNNKAFGIKTSLLLSSTHFKHAEIGMTGYFDKGMFGETVETSKQAFGAHSKLWFKNITIQAEAAFAKFDPEQGSKGTTTGYYLQLMYALTNQWIAGYRFDSYEADRSKNNETLINSFFVNYRVMPNLVLKLEHHLIDKEQLDKTTYKSIASIVDYLE